MKVEEIRDDMTGTASLDESRHEVNLALLPDIKTGDYIIVHAGFAIEKLDTDEAEKRISLFGELAEQWTNDTGNK